jgi:carbamoyltransferase
VVKAYSGSKEDFPAWFDTHVELVPHHLCHASLAMYSSEFDEAAFYCQDGGGDYGDPRNHAFGEYSQGEFRTIHEDSGFSNICTFHDYLSDSLGYTDNGKVTGLASYGTVVPALYERLKQLLIISPNGIRFHRVRNKRSTPNLAKFKPNEYERHKIIETVPSDTNFFHLAAEYLVQDIAATGEKLIQDTLTDFLANLRTKTKMQNLVMAGGLFQNVAINRVLKETQLFKQVHVPMAPGDAGLTLGAALYVASKHMSIPRKDKMTPYLGPKTSDEEIEHLLKKFRLDYSVESDIADKTAELLAAGNVVGTFYGRAEYGPRSLGHRSILADPRTFTSKQRINQNLKRRDWFMPYAPAVLHEYGSEWFKDYVYSPYMQFSFGVKAGKETLIPAAVHVDGSSRTQSVKKDVSPFFWQIIDHFRAATGVPVVLNTSFNRHGIATVSTARQAIEHLLEGCVDFLVLGDRFLIERAKNRILKDVEEPVIPERTLLIADTIDRLKVLERIATQDTIGAYLGHLSRFLGDGVEMSGNGYTYRGDKFPRMTVDETLKVAILERV